MELKIGNRIKSLRTERGITQEALAEYIGISYQAISKWETGTTMPDISLLPKLAAFFGVRIDDLFEINREDELERINRILAHKKLTEESFSYAKRVLDSILKENEKDAGALKQYAELYLAKNKRDLIKAKSMLMRAMEVSPADEEIYSLFLRVCGGDIYSFRSGNDDFISVCEPYAQKFTANYRLCEMLTEAMISMGYFDKAEALINEMKLNSETECMRNIFLGDIENAKGNIEGAKKLWRTVPADSHKGQYEIGERFNRLNEYETAIECYENSFKAAKPQRDLSAVYSLAFLYTKLGEREKAIEAWEQIINVLSTDYGITESETVDWAHREISKLKNK